MLKQKQPNGWSCLPTSFAMCLDISVEDIFNWLEHDGSQIVFPERVEPFNRRAFHPQELIDYSLLICNIPVIQIDKRLQVININEDVYNLPYKETRISSYLHNFNNVVLSGYFPESRRWHAVACCDKTIHDPNGETHKLENFTDKFIIETLFLIISV